MTTSIALAGNPNSGKTTMFNRLTGSTQRVGNWPGVTVEKKEGKLKGNKNVIIQDLPGIYSLSPYTLEEVVTRNYLVDEKPDAIINIIDASNIERNLYLTTQLLELGIPVVIALNMIDIVQKKGDTINLVKLSQILGCRIVETSAVKGTGTLEAAELALSMVQKKEVTPPQHEFNEEIESVLEKIASLVEGEYVSHDLRWYSIKLFERDKEVHKALKLQDEILNKIEALILQCEERFGDDSESIITSERYIYIGKVIDQCVTFKSATNLSTSDKIDKVVTNRILALPIFVVAMFAVYFLSITTVGTMLTNWVNEGVFGDGFYLTGGDEFEEKSEEFSQSREKATAFLDAAREKGMEVSAVEEALGAEESTDSETLIANFVKEAQARNITAEFTIEDKEAGTSETEEITPSVFAESIAMEEPNPADYGTWVPGIPTLAKSALDSMDTSKWLKELVLNGIIAGVGAVLGFLPQMLVLFLCLAILEDCGYMARIAFIMDRIFRKFGLSGKSFIPMLIGTGCGVPGVMASRTIENENDRRMTVITTIFVPCGAKLPIIALIAGALFANASWVATSAYFIGVGAIVISGIMLKKTKAFSGDPSPFVMELPAYHLPSAHGIVKSAWQRGKAFIKKAFTIIFLSTIIIWFLQNFNWNMEMVGTNESMLADMGNAIAPLFAPLGWGDWKATVATVTGLVAKETVVATFGILYGFEEVAEDGSEYWEALRSSFTQISAYSFLIFNLLCAPCFAAIGAIRREMSSGKWTIFAILYQTALAYVASLIFYQIALAVTNQKIGAWTIVAAVLLAGMIYALVRKPYAPKETK